MSGLQHIAAEIVVSEHGAAHGADADGVIQQAQFYQGLGYQLVDDAVVTAGAIVQFGISQAFGLLIYDCHIT